MVRGALRRCLKLGIVAQGPRGFQAGGKKGIEAIKPAKPGILEIRSEDVLEQRQAGEHQWDTDRKMPEDYLDPNARDPLYGGESTYLQNPNAAVGYEHHKITKAKRLAGEAGLADTWGIGLGAAPGVEGSQEPGFMTSEEDWASEIDVMHPRKQSVGGVKLLKDLNGYNVEATREYFRVLRYTTPPSRCNRRYALGFVPTQGRINEAHLALIEASQAECVFTCASVFVNPKQFDTKQEYMEFPRPLNEDCQLLAEAGVDAIYVPQAKILYPRGYATHVLTDGIDRTQEGSLRAAWYSGVNTLYVKLASIVRPNRLYVGQKDPLQHLMLKQTFNDLHLETEVVGCPIIRELDGLAYGANTTNLTPAERREAPILYRALSTARDLYDETQERAFEADEYDESILVTPDEVRATARDIIEKGCSADLHYVSLTDPGLRELAEKEKIMRGAILSVAATFGDVRMVDSVRFGVDENDYW